MHILAYPADRQTAAGPSAEIATSGDTHPVVIRRPLSAWVQSVWPDRAARNARRTTDDQPPGRQPPFVPVVSFAAQTRSDFFGACRSTLSIRQTPSRSFKSP